MIEKSGFNPISARETFKEDNLKSKEIIELEKQIIELKEENNKLKEDKARLKEKAFRDGLTGLYNRNFAEEELKRLCLSKENVSIAFIDIDGFKIINDLMSHEAGDEFLKKTASSLKKIVKGGDLAARWGGDEFLLILTDCDQEKKDIIKTLVEQTGNENNLRLSCGFATKETDNVYENGDVNNFLKIAEIAMKEDKPESSREKLAALYSK